MGDLLDPRDQLFGWVMTIFIFSGLKLPIVIFCWIIKDGIQLNFDILKYKKGGDSMAWYWWAIIIIAAIILIWWVVSSSKK